MKKFLVLLQLVVVTCYAQNKFAIDLTECGSDEVQVVFMLAQPPEKDVIRFSFPATVPGTYATLDYGRFVKSFVARDASGAALTVKKEGHNTFVITGANKLKELAYQVEDVMDQILKKNPIFQPASTNFECGRNFFLNNGGIFGFIEGEANEPVLIEVKKPGELYGATSLPLLTAQPNQQVYKARNYHQLIDCPIMFSKPDTAVFYVNTTRVTISVFDVRGTLRARQFYAALERDMKAVAKVLPALPVTDYTFIIYVDDHRELGNALNGQMGFFKKVKLAMKYRNFGVGALEHGNSSTYYLADLGDDVKVPGMSLESQLADAAIHEFMHIITPLGLHSQYLGEFDYIRPVMSKHLWLYEGVTEYFAQYVKFKGGVYTEEEFLKAMGKKFAAGSKFPVKDMSFTEMSANVLDKKYHDQYLQVYDRGAALAMLLDGEIRRLTGGQKTLLDVVLTLNARYGAEKSFDENNFFDEFTKEVDPALRHFFATYIEGRNPWQPNDQLKGMHLVYYEQLVDRGPLSPIDPEQNDIKRQITGLQLRIKEAGKNEWAGLQKGDVINYADYQRAYASNAAEGTVIKLPVQRNGKPIELSIPVKYGEMKQLHVLRKVNP